MFSVPVTANKKTPNYPYLIDRSLRFRQYSANNARLSRTYSVPCADPTKGTWSIFTKRGLMGDKGGQQALFYGFDGVSAQGTACVFNTSNQFVFAPGAVGNVTPSRVINNLTDWNHWVINYDSTLANAADRVKIWFNGVLETAFATNTAPTQNQPHQFANASVRNRIGAYWDDSGGFYEGYIAEMHFLDGIIAPPTAFGQFYAPLGGIWVPKAYTGSYGTNGFYLSFNDNTSLVTLGNDDSPNSNDWTLTNFSLGTGASAYLYDSVIDTPTDNFAVLDGLQGAAAANNTFVRGANLWIPGTATSGTGGVRNALVPSKTTQAAPFPKSGKWFWVSQRTGGDQNAVGLNRASDSTNYALGASGVGYFQNGAVYKLGSIVANIAPWTTIGDTVMVAVDCGTGSVWFGKNGVWGAGDPAAGTGAPITGINFAGEDWCASICDGSSSASAAQAINFGQQPLPYPAPAGFLPISWQGLNATEAPPPPVYPESVFVSASTDVTGTQVYVNFSQALTGSVTVGTLQYRINGGASLNVTGMTVSGSTVTGTLGVAAQQGQTLEISMGGNTTLKTLMTGNAVADFAWATFPNSALPLLGQGTLNVGNVNNLFWGKTEYPGYGSYSPASGPNLRLLQTDYTGTTRVESIDGTDINGINNLTMIVGGNQATLQRNVIPGDEESDPVTWYGGAIGDVFNLVARAGQNLTVQILST